MVKSPGVSVFQRRQLTAAIQALQSELAGGPRAELPMEYELLGSLIHTREQRAKTKEEPERELLAALPEAAAIVDRDGRVRVANTPFDALSPRGSAAGLTPLEIVRSPELSEATRRALEGHPRSLELDLPTTRRLWLAQLTPLLRGEVLLLLRDVTHAKRAEAMRRDFVANASHELRTPVAALRAAAETLLSGALDDPQAARRFVEMMSRQAERLARLAQDLLDLSRVESGQWVMSLESVELRPIAQAVLDLHAERAAEKGHRLVLRVDDGLAALADVKALEQILVNLVDNAVKYTPPNGCITVDARKEAESVFLSVTDTGPGIDGHHLSRLFERFYRVDPGRSREQGGTGLGLAIVKHLSQAQQGEVGVESGPGGSRFWVKLRLP